MKKVSLLLLAALVGACDDTSGPVRVAEVEILHSSVSVDEQVVRVGETVQLSARLLDADGNLLTGRSVTWASSLPEVATVSNSGLVTGVSAGEAIVTATAGGVSDDVIITVQAPPAPVTCADGDAGISLAVGEAYVTDAAAEQVLCISGETTGAEYVLMPYNSAGPGNPLQVEVAGSGLIVAAGPPNPALFSQSGTAGGLPVPPLREEIGFHQRLNQRVKRELGALRRGDTSIRPSYSQGPLYVTVPTVGETLRFNVNSDDGCTNPIFRGARVMAVSDRAVVVADTTNPAGGFTEAEFAHFAETFDTLVYPTITANFGIPSDIDDNGARSIILFTRAVNELTPPNQSSYVGGFFFSRDLFPKVATNEMSACPASNEAEMFYMLVPDPNGEVNDNKRSKEFVAERTVGVLAHEFQHLINASRRLFVVQAEGTTWSEEVWLNEGLSHIAEELTFYAATSLQPGQNIDIDDLRANQGTFDSFVQYQWSNFGRYIEYLKTPASQSALGEPGDQDLATRGAIWAFLRYAADRRATTESTLWRSMVDTDLQGVANLNNALGNQTLDWLRDWTTGVYTDDAVPTIALYQQPSWNFRNIITSVTSGGSQLYPTFPLKVTQLSGASVAQVEMVLQGGGANFLRFGVAGGARGAVRTTNAGLSAPARLKVTLVRTK